MALNVTEYLREGAPIPLLNNEMIAYERSQFESAEERELFIKELSERWVERAAEALGEGARVYETPHCALIASRSEKESNALALLFESVYQTICKALPGIAREQKTAIPIILFEDLEAFRAYVLAQYPNDEYLGESEGLYIDAAIAHFALNGFETPSEAFGFVAVQEMTELLLSHLKDIPLWIKEGLRQVVLRGGAHISAEMMDRHEEFWNEARVQKFFEGELFSDFEEEGDSFSAYLAAIMVATLLKNHANAALFVTEARKADAGEEASQTILGVSITSFVPPFLHAAFGVAPTENA